MAVPPIQIYRNGEVIQLFWEVQSRLLYRYFNLYASSTETGIYTLYRSYIPNAGAGAFPNHVTIQVPRDYLGITIEDGYWFKITTISVLGAESPLAASPGFRVPPIHVIGPRSRDDIDVMVQNLGWDVVDEDWKKVGLVVDGSGVPRLAVDADVNVGDITIGSVEIKGNGTTDTANVISDGSYYALVVTQTSQPLPTGAATEVTLDQVSTDLAELLDRIGDDIDSPGAYSVNWRLKNIETDLTSANISLDNIEASTQSIDNKLPDLGQQTSANSQSVVLASDHASIDVDVVSELATATPSGSLPSEVKVIGGYDGSNVQPIAVDSSGNLQVDILSGAGTEYVVDNVVPALPQGPTLLVERDDELGTIFEAEGDWTNLRANKNGALWVTHDGTLDVSIVGSSPGANLGEVGILDNSATPVRISPAREDGNLAIIAGDTTSLDGKITVCNTDDVDISTIGGATGSNNFFYENTSLVSTTYASVGLGFTTQAIIAVNTQTNSIAEISFDGGTTTHMSLRGGEVVTFDFRHVSQIHVRKSSTGSPLNPNLRVMAW